MTKTLSKTLSKTLCDTLNLEENLEVLKCISQGIIDPILISKETLIPKEQIEDICKNLSTKLRHYNAVNKMPDYAKIRIFVTKTKRHNLSLEWASQFKDYARLKVITTFLLRDENNRDSISDEEYCKIVEHFYFDEVYNKLYDFWVKSGKESIFKPSFDHIIPYSKGGKTTLNNLRCCTVLENTLKGSVDHSNWSKNKKIIIENIDLLLSSTD